MIKLFYWPTPNGHKITMFLEEADLAYEIVPINISRGEQFEKSFLKIAPNNRMPAIIDEAPIDGGDPITVFESGAILQYLAEKTAQFIPDDLRKKNESNGVVILANGWSRSDGGAKSPFRILRSRACSLCY